MSSWCVDALIYLWKWQKYLLIDGALSHNALAHYHKSINLFFFFFSFIGSAQNDNGTDPKLIGMFVILEFHIETWNPDFVVFRKFEQFLLRHFIIPANWKNLFGKCPKRFEWVPYRSQKMPKLVLPIRHTSIHSWSIIELLLLLRTRCCESIHI